MAGELNFFSAVFLEWGILRLTSPKFSKNNNLIIGCKLRLDIFTTSLDNNSHLVNDFFGIANEISNLMGNLMSNWKLLPVIFPFCNDFQG